MKRKRLVFAIVASLAVAVAGAGAAAATAIDERISQGPSTAINAPGPNLKTVLGLSQKQGKKVGDSTTRSVSRSTTSAGIPTP